jgi:hypothetical protein
MAVIRQSGYLPIAVHVLDNSESRNTRIASEGTPIKNH